MKRSSPGSKKRFSPTPPPNGDALLAEESQRRKAALEEKNDQLLLQAYQQLQAGTARFEKEARTALSRAEMEAKRALLLRREALCQEMFSHVAARLEQFSKGLDYPAYLQKRLEELEKAGRLSGSTLQAKEEDLPLLDRLTQGKGLAGWSPARISAWAAFAAATRPAALWPRRPWTPPWRTKRNGSLPTAAWKPSNPEGRPPPFAHASVWA